MMLMVDAQVVAHLSSGEIDKAIQDAERYALLTTRTRKEVALQWVRCLRKVEAQRARRGYFVSERLSAEG